MFSDVHLLVAHATDENGHVAHGMAYLRPTDNETSWRVRIPIDPNAKHWTVSVEAVDDGGNRVAVGTTDAGPDDDDDAGDDDDDGDGDGEKDGGCTVTGPSGWSSKMVPTA